MSFEVLTRVLHHSKASPTQKMVLTLIADRDGPGGAWPSVKYLAERVNLSPRSVTRAIGELVAIGELRVDTQGGGFANMRDEWRPNLYHVLVECPGDCDQSPNHVACPTDKNDRGVPTNLTGGVGTGMSPEPVLANRTSNRSVGSRGATAASPRGEGARMPRKIPRQGRNRKPLTDAERVVCWNNFRNMDMEGLIPDDEKTLGAVFLKLEKDYGAFEPDKWVQSLIDRGGWEQFVQSTELADIDASTIEFRDADLAS